MRNRGTIGGNVAHADPASDLPTVLVGARRPLRRRSGRQGERTIAADDFFTGHDDDGARRRRDPHRDRVPAAGAGRGHRRTRSSRIRPRGTPSIGVAAASDRRRRRQRHARRRVALGGLLPAAQPRRRAVETALAGKALDTAAIAAAARALAMRSRRRRERRPLRVGRVLGGGGARLRQARGRTAAVATTPG